MDPIPQIYTPHPTRRVERAICFDRTVASTVPDTMDHFGFLVDECVIEDNLEDLLSRIGDSSLRTVRKCRPVGRGGKGINIYRG